MSTNVDRVGLRSFINPKWLSLTLKRTLDIILSAIILVLISPILGFIALAIRRDSPGPVFYRGTRIGQGGKSFKMLKFRTMYETPESYKGPRVTAHDDPRITPLGRWLRGTKLNELPQFWNVLIGDMSLVGPRPEDPSIAKTWPRNSREEILSVRPGITSPASILYRNEEGLLCSGNVLDQYIQELSPDKMRLDELYVRYRSVFLDLDVLFWTALIMLPRISAQSIPEQLLFVGPFTRLMRRYVNWFVIDWIVTFCAVSLTGVIWRQFGPLNIGWPKAILLATGFAFLFSLIGAILGVNRIAWSKAEFEDAFDLLPVWLLAITIAILICKIISVSSIGLVFIASIPALCGYVIIRFRSRLYTGFMCRLLHYRTRTMSTCEQVLIVGTNPNAQYILWLLHQPAYARKFHIVGITDNNPFNQGMRIYGETVLGRNKDVAELVNAHDIGVVIVADRHVPAEDYRAIIDTCKIGGIRLVEIPDVLANLNNLVDAQPRETKSNIGLSA